MTESHIEVAETAFAKTTSAIDVRVDDVGSILNVRLGFLFDRSLHWLSIDTELLCFC